MPRYTLRFNGPQITEAVKGAAAAGLLDAAEYVLGESSGVVPIDEAALQRSGNASVDEGQLIAAVSYSTPYAVPQHERMDYRHAPGRQAKYLEGPLNAAGGPVLALIAARLRRAIR